MVDPLPARSFFEHLAPFFNSPITVYGGPSVQLGGLSPASSGNYPVSVYVSVCLPLFGLPTLYRTRTYQQCRKFFQGAVSSFITLLLAAYPGHSWPYVMYQPCSRLLGGRIPLATGFGHFPGHWRHFIHDFSVGRNIEAGFFSDGVIFFSSRLVFFSPDRVYCLRKSFILGGLRRVKKYVQTGQKK